MVRTGNDCQQKQSWITWTMQRRWARLTLLISIAVFELGFTWFILYFGWLESVNIWTQLGVITIALLPLLIAAAFLFRRRFSMKSAFIALTMFTLFMALTFRPVYEARRLRAPAKKLMGSGMTLVEDVFEFRFDDDVPAWNRIEAAKSKRDQWWIRLLGKEASILTSEEVMGVHVNEGLQLKVLAEVVDQLPNMRYLGIEAAMPDEVLVQWKDGFEQSSLESFGVTNFQNKTRITQLKWLEGNSNFRVGSFWACRQTPEVFSRLEKTNMEVVSFHINGPDHVPLDWTTIFSKKSFQQLKFLSLHGYQMTNSEGKELSRLQNLKGLSIGESMVTDYEFLQKMQNLRSIQINFNRAFADNNLPRMKFPSSLRKVTLTTFKALSEESTKKIRGLLPEGCELITFPKP